MKEEWRPITDYEGLYEVSNTGKVRSLDRFVTYKDGKVVKHKGRELKPTIKKSGYYQVSLNKDNIRKSFRLHRLVAKEFVVNKDPNKYSIVNHLDGDKLNCCADNLEWTDESGNMKHAYKTGLIKISPEAIAKATVIFKEYNAAKSIRVAKVDPNTDEILDIYESLGEAARSNNIIQSANIGACASGKVSISHGYKWKFV